MNTYSNPLTITHTLSQQDIGGGTDTQKLVGPAGHRGRVVMAAVQQVTEAFTATTLAGIITIGDGSDADKYASFGLGTTAIDAVLAATDAQLFQNAEIAADETPTVTMTAPTGGTPAGIADVVVVIDWYV
jgi:hypothetical protein